MANTTRTASRSGSRTASRTKASAAKRTGSARRSSSPAGGTARSGAGRPARSNTTRVSRTRASTAQRDAIAVLRQQHREVEKLFEDFSKAGEGAARTRRRLVDRMIAALSQHASIEEQYFYPAVRHEVEPARDDVLEALEEHHVVKWQLQELEDLDPSDERFEAKVTVMMENVRHHVHEEEGTLFPEVRRVLGRARLREIGAALVSASRVAPSRPHPRSPSTPPANLVADPIAGAVDRARDLVRSARPGH